VVSHLTQHCVVTYWSRRDNLSCFSFSGHSSHCCVHDKKIFIWSFFYSLLTLFSWIGTQYDNQEAMGIVWQAPCAKRHGGHLKVKKPSHILLSKYNWISVRWIVLCTCLARWYFIAQKIHNKILMLHENVRCAHINCWNGWKWHNVTSSDRWT
jgi:hypothetical protein